MNEEHRDPTPEIVEDESGERVVQFTEGEWERFLRGIDERLEGAVERAVERAKSATPTGPPYSGPLPPTEDDPDRPHIQAFGSNRKELFDTRGSINLWNGRIERCRCGAVEYGFTQRFTGERAIRDALRPTVNKKGDMIQRPWMPASRKGAEALLRYFQGKPRPPALDGDLFMPDELVLTDEKAAHLRECEEKLGPEFVLPDVDTLKAHAAANTLPQLAKREGVPQRPEVDPVERPNYDRTRSPSSPPPAADDGPVDLETQ